jgi:RIO kinase 1
VPIVSLEQLVEDGVVDEVLSRLKSGKEADVWLVRHRDEVLCAKVYKDRNFRSFKNNAGYKEGRAVRNTRTQRAMDRGSKFGQAAAEEEWKSAESDALHRLHAEGVRVPAPVLFYEGILLMKLVLDAEGQPAPRLIEAHLTPEQAAAAYTDLRAQAVKMLCCDLIHGDLSPYNVLLAAEGPTIIDFPQVVSAAQNSTAESFFTRDVENLRKFFGDIEPKLLERTGDAAEIWRAYVRRDLTPDFVPSGKPLPVPQERKPPREHRPQGQHARPPGQQQRPRAPSPQRPPGQPPQRPHQQHPKPQHARSGPQPQARPPQQQSPKQQQHRPAQQARPQQGQQARPQQGQQARPGNSRPQHQPRPGAQPSGQQSRQPQAQQVRPPQPHQARPSRPPPKHQRPEVPQEKLPPQLARSAQGQHGGRPLPPRPQSPPPRPQQPAGTPDPKKQPG